MKVILFSDLHAHPFAQFARVLPGGRNSRLQDALDALARVRDAGRRSAAVAAVFGGDLFHTMSRLDVATLNAVFAGIAAFAPLPVFLLVGNHDQADRSGTHSLEVFRALPHVVVMDEPGWHTHAAAPGLGVFAVPYRDDANEVRRRLASIPMVEHSHRLLLLHTGFDGARTGPHEYRMSAELASCDVPDGFDFVFSGHYHLPQWIDEARRIAYIGATTHQTWGDANQPRGYVLADLGARTLERHETGAPRFLRVTPDALDTVRPGDFVEVLLPHDADDTTLAAARSGLERAGAGGGQVLRAAPPDEAPAPRLSCGALTDVAALIEPYVAHVTGEEEQRPPLVALGQDLLREAAA